jgi:hypothetical protein
MVVKDRAAPGIDEALSPRLKWRAITLATLVLVPGFWALLTGLVAAAADDQVNAPNATAALAIGLAVTPFAFLVLAVMSQQRHVPRAVLKAMGISLLVCLTVAVVAMDAVTAMVAGAGAGGVVALRLDSPQSYRSRAMAVFLVTVYTFLLVRFLGAPTLLFAPVLSFTSIGVADHITERRRERDAGSRPD